MVSLSAPPLNGSSSVWLWNVVSVTVVCAIRIALPVLLGKAMAGLQTLCHRLSSSAMNAHFHSTWLSVLTSFALCSATKVVNHVCFPWFFSAPVIFGVKISWGVRRRLFLHLVPGLKMWRTLWRLIPLYLAVNWKDLSERCFLLRSWVLLFGVISISCNKNNVFVLIFAS